MQKVAIVTGGGRGIGAATCRLLASRGYAVGVNYLHRKDSADALVTEINGGGGQAIAIQANVANEDEVKTMFDAVEKQFASVTYLVNNAGVLFKQSSLVDIDVQRFQAVLNNNVISCFLCCREFVRRINPTRMGSAIVNVSSVAARTGSPFEYVDYAASKGAVDSLTKGLSIELAARGVRVNGVRPGFIDTDMHADGGEPDRIIRLAPQIPLQRGGTPEEVANAIAWLLSDEATYITGSMIDVAGGK
jgi:NAD(P)-dependent dehydrogenase (short-subunit alcohol dehydrogenase family)